MVYLKIWFEQTISMRAKAGHSNKIHMLPFTHLKTVMIPF